MLLRHYTLRCYNKSFACILNLPISSDIGNRIWKLRKIHYTLRIALPKLHTFSSIHPDVHIIYPCQIKFIFQNQYYILNNVHHVMRIYVYTYICSDEQRGVTHAYIRHVERIGRLT